MIELPKSMRQMIIDQMDENFGLVGKDGAAEDFAQAVIDAIEASADELDDETGDEIVSHLEASGELEDSLEDTMAAGFEDDPEFDYIGEAVMRLIERMCNIKWSEEASVDLFGEDEDY